MSTPLVVTQLLLKKAEVEAQIASLSDRLADARADLFHVTAAVRLFDPTLVDRPATVYHGVTRAMKRRDLFALCRAALEASPEPLNTRQLARHVITVEGWDADDRRLKVAIAHKVGSVMGRMALRGVVLKSGTREGATVWKLASSGGLKAGR